MTWNRLLKFTLAIIILLASWSCSSSGSDTDDDASPTGLGTEGEITLPDYPLISIIEAEPRVASPGQQISLTGVEGVTGTLTFSTPEREPITAIIENGIGVISLSQNAPAGTYTGMLETENGALAFSTFRVAVEPGVWLRTSQRFVSPEEETVLSIETLGLPEETVATVYMLSEAGEPMSILVPDEVGRLIPGIPVPLSDLEGRSLLLDSRYQGAVQVRVEPIGSDPSGGIGISEAPIIDEAEAPLFDGWVSNTIQLTACAQSGIISGDIGGEGFINAVWADGTLQSNAVYTTDGSFSIEAGPGVVLVQAFRVDQEPIPEPESQLLALGCGETVELAQVGRTKVASLASAWTSTGIPSIRAQAPGEIPPSQPVAQSGGDEPCRTGMIWTLISDSDGASPRWSSLAAVALKTALNGAASKATISTMADARALAEKYALMELTEAAEEDKEEIMEALVSLAASDFTIPLQASMVSGNYFVGLLAHPVNPGDAQVRASGEGSAGALFDPTFSAYTDFAERFRGAAICGSAEPEQKQIELDEGVPIIYTVTDLAGEGADGASVTISPPKCGQLDPAEGSVDGQEFRTEFTMDTEKYCAEALEFEASWSGPQGSLSTKPGETIVHLSPQLPELTLYAGAAPGIGNTAALASAITLYEDYDVRNQPGGLPTFTQDPVCGFLEGGMELTGPGFFTHSESPGKRAESMVQVYRSEDTPVNRVVLNMRLDTWAVPIGDDNIIRGAWASGANASNPILTETPGTLLVYDLKNPGNLPTVPIISWELGRNLEGASAHTILIIYKVIDCGDDPGISDFGSFVTTDARILLESDDDFPSPSWDIEELPEFDGERLQIIMWVNSLVTTASIRDDDEGAYIHGRGRLNLLLNVHLAQEID